MFYDLSERDVANILSGRRLNASYASRKTSELYRLLENLNELDIDDEFEWEFTE